MRCFRDVVACLRFSTLCPPQVFSMWMLSSLAYAGIPVEMVRQYMRRYCASPLLDEMTVPSTRRAIERHISEGHLVVFLSASPLLVTEPLACGWRARCEEPPDATTRTLDEGRSTQRAPPHARRAGSPPRPSSPTVAASSPRRPHTSAHTSPPAAASCRRPTCKAPHPASRQRHWGP